MRNSRIIVALRSVFSNNRRRLADNCTCTLHYGKKRSYDSVFIRLPPLIRTRKKVNRHRAARVNMKSLRLLLAECGIRTRPPDEIKYSLGLSYFIIHRNSTRPNYNIRRILSPPRRSTVGTWRLCAREQRFKTLFLNIAPPSSIATGTWL